jgi:AcrR family transcriptional regulator
VSATKVTIHRTLDARQLDVRARLLSAARQLIREHGHEAVGMEVIATTAGVSRATTYRYFASKDHVVCEAALAWGHDVAARIPGAIAAATGSATAIDVAIEQVVREAVSDLPMVRATMASVLAQGPVADEFRLGVRQMFLALLGGATNVPESLSLDPAMTVLGRVFFADLALLGVGDITVEQCIAELRLAARRLLADNTSDNASERTPRHPGADS